MDGLAMMSDPGQKQGVVILGSTGSVGTSTLSVIDALPGRFTVVGLGAGNNQRALQEQIDRYQPKYACIDHGANLSNVRQLNGPSALIDLATLEEADIVVVATTGHTAIEPTIAALRAGKVVALANKETIVAAGEIVMAEAARHPNALRTIDSEHSALWQCLEGGTYNRNLVKRLILTGSGGPFRGRSVMELATVRPEDALKHPNWSMGAKITIDSATLMNKGLEIIEAMWLFNCPLESVDLVIHPEQIVHSLVEYQDGALLAQMGDLDMRLPIQYALTWPDRVTGPTAPIDLIKIGKLTFEEPDLETFPLVRLARESARIGSTAPAVLSAADQVAVQAFLDRRIGFLEIASLVEDVLQQHQPVSGPLTLDAIHEADRWALQAAEAWVRQRERL
jgi:1-deoxy-D-xylulose-5-phosphate reductoisomerase